MDSTRRREDSRALPTPRSPEQLRDQRRGFVRPLVELPVDEEGRRPLHPAPDASEVVSAHPGSMDSGLDLLLESLDVEVRLLRKMCQPVVVHLLLVLVQYGRHLPETALAGRRFGGLCSELCQRMDLRERKMAKRKGNRVTQVVRDLEHHRIRARAMRTLKVSVLHHGQGGIHASSDVVMNGEWDRQGRHPASRQLFSAGSSATTSAAMTNGPAA